MPRLTGALAQIRSDANTVSPEAAPAGETHIGIYARISDAYEGAETGVTTQGVDRQVRACRLIAEARGWSVARKYVDNDVSAFKEGVRRDEFEALLADLSSGVIDGIVCYNLDRFARQVNDLERAIRIYDQGRRAKTDLVFATAEGDLNLASDDGLTMARVMVAFANKSSRDTGRRISAQQKEKRDGGRAQWPAPPFGLRAIGRGSTLRYEIDAEQARLVRQAAAAMSKGNMSWSAIARSWSQTGVLTATGKTWTPDAVKAIVRNPRIAGYLVHDGQIAEHSRTGELIRMTNAPAIVTDDEYEAMMLADQANRRGSPSHNGHDGRKKYLLSGIARCELCGARMMGNAMKRGDKIYPQYVCSRSQRAASGEVACAKVSISTTGLDEMIVSLVLPRIIEDTQGVVADEPEPFGDELGTLKSEKDQLRERYRRNRSLAELVFPRVTEIEERIEELYRLRSAWQRSRATRKRDEAVTTETWPALGVEEQARLVGSYVRAVYIGTATRRGNRFDPERVSEPVWRARP